MIDELALGIWNDYAAIFDDLWGIDAESSSLVGLYSKPIFAAEFSERGARAYRDSVVLPIRNAFYGCSVVQHRWELLKALSMKSPILDYGCGVGVTAIWLKEHGYDVYGYELPGIQRRVMRQAFAKRGVKEWRGERMETVICLNVLEHVSKPLALLDKLRRIGRRVIANPGKEQDGHVDAPHIASDDALARCQQILEQEGTMFVANY